ncbi:MAG: nuclear transport factor 2 family protein [Betaproteobacteria bacterium]
MDRDEKALREIIDRGHRATAAGDVETVLTLRADDVVFLQPGKPPMNGRGAFERGLRDLLAGAIRRRLGAKSGGAERVHEMPSPWFDPDTRPGHAAAGCRFTPATSSEDSA